MVEKFNIY